MEIQDQADPPVTPEVVVLVVLAAAGPQVHEHYTIVEQL
jgi:hypothetical protein